MRTLNRFGRYHSSRILNLWRIALEELHVDANAKKLRQGQYGLDRYGFGQQTGTIYVPARV